MTPENKKLAIFGLACLMFLTGFAAADVLLFKGATTPDALKPLIGWIICIGAGGYLTSLFLKQNKA
jgi:hypothetical protein